MHYFQKTEQQFYRCHITYDTKSMFTFFNKYVLGLHLDSTIFVHKYDLYKILFSSEGGFLLETFDLFWLKI